MAYIHKMTVYFVDPNEENSVRDIMESLENIDYFPCPKLVEGKTKEFEWDDDSIINRIDISPTEVEKFFNNL